MKLRHQFTSITVREDDQYVAICLELDVSGQGKNIEEAKRELSSAIENCLETNACRYLSMN